MGDPKAQGTLNAQKTKILMLLTGTGRKGSRPLSRTLSHTQQRGFHEFIITAHTAGECLHFWQPQRRADREATCESLLATCRVQICRMGRAAELGPAPAEPGEVAGEQKADFKSVLGNKMPSSAREAQTVLGERPGRGKQSRFSGAAGNFRCPTLGTENGLVKHAGTCPGEIRSWGKSP